MSETVLNAPPDQHSEFPKFPPAEAELKELVAQHILQPMSAIRVANEVIWINPNCSSTRFPFTVGQATELALMVAQGPLKRTPDQLLYARRNHNRSAIISANSGFCSLNEQYPYLDAKGIGHLAFQERSINSAGTNKTPGFMSAQPIEPYHVDQRMAAGLVRAEFAVTDIKNSLLLAKAGISTAPIVALVRVDQLVDPGGLLIPINEAKEKGYIPNDLEPVIQFRAWSCPFRLADIAFNPELDILINKPRPQKDLNRRRNILLTAIRSLQKDNVLPVEAGSPLTDYISYFTWLAATLGENVGRMHGMGIAHGFLAGAHNFSLDGRIVDLDGLKQMANPEEIQCDQDYICMEDSHLYNNFFNSIPPMVGVHFQSGELREIVLASYYRTLGDTRSRRNGFFRNLFRGIGRRAGS